MWDEEIGLPRGTKIVLVGRVEPRERFRDRAEHPLSHQYRERETVVGGVSANLQLELIA